MPNTIFKNRLAQAVEQLVVARELLSIKKNCLYTPARIEGECVWTEFSRPDGLLARRITVDKGRPDKADEHSDVIACVMVESEETTSDSLLNPWGKSCIPTIPNGVWIDIEEEEKRKRCILTTAHVILVTPEPTNTTAKVQRKWRRRLSILQRVDAAAAGMTLVVAERGIGAEALAAKLWTKAKAHLHL
jgi:hypothetical protein